MKTVSSNRRFVKQAVGVLFSSILFALPAAAASPTQLKIVSASPGGIWYTLGARYAQLLEQNLDDVRVTAATGGSVPNARNVNDGKADVGIIYSDFAKRAREGEAPFRDKHSNLRILATIAPGKLQFAVSETGDIRSLADMSDKRLNGAAIGTGTREIAQMALAGADITYQSMKANGGNVVGVGHNDGMNMMQNRQLDAIVFVGGAGSHIMSLDSNPGVRILPIDGEVRDRILSSPANENGMYFKDTITSDMYDFIEEPIPTISVMQVFLVNKDLSDDLAYEMVKVIYEKGDDLRKLFPGQFKETFNLEDASKGGSIPFHEGTKRYFAEQGIQLN